jgi:hypothetical protein
VGGNLPVSATFQNKHSAVQLYPARLPVVQAPEAQSLIAYCVPPGPLQPMTDYSLPQYAALWRRKRHRGAMNLCLAMQQVRRRQERGVLCPGENAIERAKGES